MLNCRCFLLFPGVHFHHRPASRPKVSVPVGLRSLFICWLRCCKSSRKWLKGDFLIFGIRLSGKDRCLAAPRVLKRGCCHAGPYSPIVKLKIPFILYWGAGTVPQS